MEQINKVEIRGTVGNIRVQTFEDGNQSANFSVVTNYSYRGRDGSGVIETFWFNVTAWSGKNMPSDFNEITKGSVVHVVGRLREREYEASDGAIKRIVEVVAYKVTPVEVEEPLSSATA